MQGGMRGYQAVTSKTNKEQTWREMNPLATPTWDVTGHLLETEQGKPAVEWTEFTSHYVGDSEDAAMRCIWDEITDTDRVLPYVIFIHRMGDMYKRIDIR